jgi:superfamily II helicase
VIDLEEEKQVCLYCSEAQNKKWFSEWNRDHHYKNFVCECCGKKNFVAVDFQGSGHDSWSGLEGIVEK